MWVDYVTAIGSVTTPILVLALAGLGWRVRARIERQFTLEDELREDRISTYNLILEPFVMLLMSEAAWRSDRKNAGVDKNEMATRKLLSLEYRSQGFRLSLFGSDEVVRSFNDLMQYFFQRGDQTQSYREENVREIMSLLSRLLLEIRRLVGNESTKLDSWDMLEWFLSDARKFRPQK
ncbi:MAG: hypothetical protein HUU16_14750 [Candidatus Omnitrophica bacterium]|nr:hypothetical protein [bacterium]NUN97419.1 hypothetical protein [Candidatus Omnitrophota bacterium]